MIRRSALLLALTCLMTALGIGPVSAPLGTHNDAHADELEEILATGRFVVVMNVTGHKRAKKINDDFFDIFAFSERHIVDRQEFLEQSAADAGVTEDEFWNDPELVVKASTDARIDAIIVPTLSREDRRYTLTVRLVDGATGNIAGEFDVELGKKYRLKDEHKEEILNQANDLFEQTGWLLKEYYEQPQLVTITITSEPTGATVVREGEVLGTTPAKIEREVAEVEEVWELTYENKPAGIVRVDLQANNTYTVELQGVAPPEEEEPSGSLGAAALGRARPLLDIGLGTDLTSRSTTVEVDRGTGLNYSSSLYPTLNLELDFFPLALVLDNAYASSIGLHATFGYGSVTSAVPVFASDESKIVDNAIGSCTIQDPNAPPNQKAMDCPTTHLEFAFGATFRLLLSSDEEGELDPDGMFASATLGYSSRDFDIDDNPTYEGHGYQGILVALGFGTPLGLPELRLDVNAQFIPLLTFGAADMIGEWGRTASGFGIGGGLRVSYDVFEGLYAQLGYDANYYVTNYEGFGCQSVNEDNECTVLRNDPNEGGGTSTAGDFFNQILIQVGYRIQ